MKTLIKRYLDAYIENRLASEADIFSKDFTGDYSTVGKIEGFRELSRLKTPGDFPIRYNIVSNEIDYVFAEKETVILNCFHFFVRVSGREYHPLIFGGKYKFIISEGKIKNIRFDLEAESGNTYLAKKDWNYKLFSETKDDRRVLLDKVSELKQSDEEQIRDAVKKMMFIIDSQQEDMISDLCQENATVSLSDTTYPEQYGPEVSNNGISATEFVRFNKKTEDQNHHSMQIGDIKVEGDQAEVSAVMFEPTKMGYKHFDILTIYKPYFNESWKIRLNKENGKWKIAKMKNEPISVFQQPSYTTLEI